MNRILILLGLIAVLMLLSACGSEGNDLTSIPDITFEGFDWDIMVVDLEGSNAKESSYWVNCEWLGSPSAISNTDVFSIKFDDQSYVLTGFNLGTWSFNAEAMLNPGTTYAVEFYKNGTKIANSTLKTPYRATVTFPATFDPAMPASLSWSLAESNPFQAISVFGYDPENDDSSDAEIFISSSDRSYTIPAQTIESFGANGEYDITLMQADFHKAGRYAFTALHGRMNEYNTIPTKEAYVARLQAMAKQIR